MKTKLNGKKSIIETLFSSEVKVELPLLFHGNPGITDTIDGIALRIGKNGHEVKPDMDDFVNLGIVKKRTLGKDREIFQLDRVGDKTMQKALDKYFKSLNTTKMRRAKDLE